LEHRNDNYGRATETLLLREEKLVEVIEIFFSNEKFGEIRAVITDGEPWFVGKDVATALGYKDAKKL
jgi:prophage antirepressor-like protein